LNPLLVSSLSLGLGLIFVVGGVVVTGMVISRLKLAKHRSQRIGQGPSESGSGSKSGSESLSPPD